MAVRYAFMLNFQLLRRNLLKSFNRTRERLILYNPRIKLILENSKVFYKCMFCCFVQVAARILQDTALGKNHASDKVNLICLLIQSVQFKCHRLADKPQYVI
jgi:hypothetical protein